MIYRRLAGAITFSILASLARAQTIAPDSSNPSDNHKGKKTMSRVTGIGGIFLKAKDPAMLRAWYKKHLGIDVQAWGGTAFRWVDSSGHPVGGKPLGPSEMARTSPRARHHSWSITGCPIFMDSWPRSVLKDVTSWRKPRNPSSASLAGSWTLRATK